MKKILALLLSVIMTAALCSCGDEEFNKEEAFKNLRDYFTGEFESGNYYIQMSETSADKHIVTEASRYGDDDKAFLSYDEEGSLTFFRNGKLIEAPAEKLYAPEEKTADWNKYPYGKIGETYYEAMKTLCSTDFSKLYTPAYPEINVSESGNSEYPYKVSAIGSKKINAEALFHRNGNFELVSIKFLSDKDGKNFEDITLHVQYTFKDEIYVIAVRFGDPSVPDTKGNNGQRPEDIENVYNSYIETLHNSVQDYLSKIQQNMNDQQS